MKRYLLCAILGLLVAGILPLCALADEPGGLSFKQRGGWTEGHCGAMVVDQRTVYLANGAWLEDIDVTDPALPRVRSRVELSAGIVDLARTQGRICALTADRALHVVRDDAGRGLQVAGRLDFEHERSASPWGMTVVGPYVYVNDGRSLHIVDITGARQPLVVKSLDSPFAPCVMRSAEATGNTLYLGNESTTLIFDVSDPLQPVPVRDLGAPGEPLTINDGLLNTSYGGLSFLWDIADPMAPRAIGGGLAGEYWGPGFAVHDTLLYITDWNVAVYTREGRRLSWGVTPAWNMAELESQGDHLLARQEGLTILGLSDPFAPAVVGRHRTGVGIQDLQFVGDRAYFAGGVGRLTVMDVADPDRPELLGAWVGPDERTDPRSEVVSVNGGRALVGGCGGGTWVLDVTDPAAIRPLGLRLGLCGINVTPGPSRPEPVGSSAGRRHRIGCPLLRTAARRWRRWTCRSIPAKSAPASMSATASVATSPPASGWPKTAATRSASPTLSQASKRSPWAGTLPPQAIPFTDSTSSSTAPSPTASAFASWSQRSIYPSHNSRTLWARVSCRSRPHPPSWNGDPE
ncbi:MAG: hypothetical protein IPH86_13580 [bacterium]|nr:hypothetical protein [bacterium]